jgi:hypothetical protein
MNELMRLLLIVLVAGAMSFVAGFTASKIAALIPCEGEGLACNIDEAVGAYGVLIGTPLGAAVFALTLLVASNRIALTSTTILLLTPLLLFFAIAELDAWRYVGFYPYKDLRTLLVMLLPPALTVLIQALVLSAQLLSHDKLVAAASESAAP